MAIALILADKNDQALAASDASVEQIARSAS
jgi:hypothetical protein